MRSNASLPVDEHDESVRIAIKALGDMRNSRPGIVARADDSYFQQTPALSMSSSSASLNSSSIAPPTFPDSPDVSPSVAASESPNSPQFVSRVSHLPLVNTALRAYEKGKASSSVVKYGAEMMESSVMTISSRLPLPVNVNTLDEFACRQLDRLHKYRRPSSSSLRNLEFSMQVDGNDPIRTRDLHLEREWTGNRVMEGEGKVPVWLESTRTSYIPARPESPSASSTSSCSIPPRTRSPSPSRSRSSTPQPRPPFSQEREVSLLSEQEQQQQIITPQRSRWHSVLLEAGGLSAALSEESMKRLKYCLQWLQYATAHIDQQILVLRDFTATLQPLSPGTPSSYQESEIDEGESSNHSPSSPQVARSPTVTSHSHHQRQISQAHLRKLTTIRKDLIHTIRQVVDVVSKYAGGALPEPARSRVRGFILTLPKRWVTASGVPASGVVEDHGGGPPIDLSISASGLQREDREVVAAAAAAGSTGGSLRRRRGAYAGTGAIRGISVPGPDSLSEQGGSTNSSPVASPLASPRIISSGPSSERGISPAGFPPPGVGGGLGREAAIIAAQRILTLATESLDMMRGVTSVVKDSLDKAEEWVGRLAIVGVGTGATVSSGRDESLRLPRIDEQWKRREEEEEEIMWSRSRRPSSSEEQERSPPRMDVDNADNSDNRQDENEET